MRTWIVTDHLGRSESLSGTSARVTASGVLVIYNGSMISAALPPGQWTSVHLADELDPADQAAEMRAAADPRDLGPY